MQRALRRTHVVMCGAQSAVPSALREFGVHCQWSDHRVSCDIKPFLDNSTVARIEMMFM
jgi:hypothetical protein